MGQLAAAREILQAVADARARLLAEPNAPSPPTPVWLHVRTTMVDQQLASFAGAGYAERRPLWIEMIALQCLSVEYCDADAVVSRQLRRAAEVAP